MNSNDLWTEWFDNPLVNATRDLHRMFQGADHITVDEKKKKVQVRRHGRTETHDLPDGATTTLVCQCTERKPHRKNGPEIKFIF